MDLLTDAIGLLASDPDDAKPRQRPRKASESRSESPSDFISKEDSIAFGPIFPLPQFGQGYDSLTARNEFSLPQDFVQRFLWYQKRSEKHHERMGNPLPTKTLTTKDERRLAKLGKEATGNEERSGPGPSNGERGLAIVGKGRSGGSGNKPPAYKHLKRNTFFGRSHVVLPPDEIQVCECTPSSGCSLDHCLNAVTHVECTPGFCPCEEHCQNQRFQRCEYANVLPCKTEGRGWGLYAQEDIQEGQFIVEYCGEIINDREAVKRSEEYRREGLRDHYMLSLSGTEVIDASKKGSYGRFINHSCGPSCVTKKWNVLGEVRVGVFAHRFIPRGEELTYDYDFEWYGGEKVRCQCGAAACIGFLGAKSKRFKEDLVLWEDDDERYEIDNVPTYDSDDEPIGGRQPAYYSSDGEASSRDSGEPIMSSARGDFKADKFGQTVAGKRSSESETVAAAVLPPRKRKIGHLALAAPLDAGATEAGLSDDGPSIHTTVEKLSVSAAVVDVKTGVNGTELTITRLEAKSTVAEGQSHERTEEKPKPARKRVKKEVSGLGARLRLVKEHKKVVRGSGITGGRLVVTKPVVGTGLSDGRRGRVKKGLGGQKGLGKPVTPVHWVPSPAALEDIRAKEAALVEARLGLERLKQELKPSLETCIESKLPAEPGDAQRWVASECLVAKAAFERHLAFLKHGLGLAGLVVPKSN